MANDEKPNLSELPSFEQKEKNYHSNIIVDSRHDFSLLEKKIMYCVINQLSIKSQNEAGNFVDQYFKIPISIFGEDYGFSNVKAACDKIITRSIVGGEYKKKKAWGFVPFPWYEIENGHLHIQLHKAAVPYFVDLKLKGYTAYKLDIAFSLSSVYSQRLYELLSRFKDTCKWYKVEIEQLKFLLGIDKKDKAFNGPNANGHIKAKILEVARKELAEKTDLEFQYSFEKEGRKFVRINFDIFTKKLKNHIERKDAKEGKQLVLEELNAALPEQQMVFLHTALSQYDFTEEQKAKIIAAPNLALKFVEVHVQLIMGVSKPNATPTAYVAGILRALGWS